ncbi:putative MOSC domain-containing protein [Streptomyces viridochromogenes Tue57]|uniref:Putative MOSC domain-containing protein n=2 Tax=Streptomyces viridochromogenes TaxID=1938 RepID=L8PR79_STRVR|nr:putative MOSC domain-containing protein [Streptomyces viridochromogenes Tue57]
MNRFRPNIVIDGWDEPHTEERVHGLTIGTAELGYAKLAIRCAVTLAAQESGERSGPEPLRTLAGYRRARPGQSRLRHEVLRAPDRPGRRGDAVTVTSWGESELHASDGSPRILTPR